MTRSSGEDRYEQSDAHARPVLYAAIALALVLGLSMAASAWISHDLAEGVRAEEDVNPVSILRRPPEGPALQSVPANELELHRAWEERLLTGTEWIDPLNQVVRIPIDRAVELCLEEGYPVRTEAKK